MRTYTRTGRTAYVAGAGLLHLLWLRRIRRHIKISSLPLNKVCSWKFWIGEDPAHPPVAVEMNDIKRRIDEIEAGGVDEQKELLDLETAVARFESVLHQSNTEVANTPPLPPRSPASRIGLSCRVSS